MDIQLRTELGDLFRRDRSVEQAVSLLQAQETWFAEHRAESNAQDPDDYRDGAD